MGHGILPLYSSHLYNFGNMDEASSSSTFPQELEEIIEDTKVTFYSNNFSLEPDLYSYYQQPDDRAVDVPFQRPPLMIDYQSASVNNDHNLIFQQPLSPRMKLSDWRCQQSFQAMENPKKRMNDVREQKVVNKKLAHQERSQGIGCVRERVPMRRSQKLADKITALQKLVSPYGKTDTASVLQEAHISINLLHGQIQNLLLNTQTSMINYGPLQSRNHEEAETSLQNRGLCLVPISSPKINSLFQGKPDFILRNY